MADEKVHRESIIDQPSMTSVVTKEYLVLPFSDVVIHKKFFEFWTVFAFVGTSILWGIGVFTTVYQGFAASVLSGMAVHPELAIFVFAMFGLLVFIVYKINHPKRKKVPTVIK